LPVGEPLGERAVRGGQVGDPLTHVVRILPHGQGQLDPLGFGDWFGFRGAERRVRLAGVAAMLVIGPVSPGQELVVKAAAGSISCWVTSVPFMSLRSATPCQRTWSTAGSGW
jgi:hypothetical protein